MTIPIVMMILADISMMKFSNLTVQVYSPESAESTDSEVSWLLDDMYNVNNFISGLIGDAITVPSGPFHTIITELISTVQVKMGGCP